MGFVYNRQTDDYDYVDEGDTPKSPYEQAHEAGTGDDFDKAVSEYYGGGNDTASHDPVNWYDPSTYSYLTNTPSTLAPTTRPDNPPAPPPTHPGPSAPGLSQWGRTFDFTPTTRTSPTLAAFKGPDLPQIPDFKGPAPFQYTKTFAAPTGDSILADPSYEFRKSQGEGAMLNSAVAQGIGRSGGTLKDFINYNQAFASQEYKNIYDRDLGVYQMDRANAADEYDRTYKQLVDEFDLNRQTKFGVYDRGLNAAQIGYSGDELRYSTETQTAQRQAEQEWQHAYDQYVQSWNEWKQNQDQIMWTYDYEKSLV